jgi:hypothetical protein
MIMLVRKTASGFEIKEQTEMTRTLPFSVIEKRIINLERELAHYKKIQEVVSMEFIDLNEEPEEPEKPAEPEKEA